MIDLLSLHKYFLSEHIKEGDTVADFTMGNGNDTLWLSKTVGKTGHVYSFDIQESALVNTKKRLEENGAPENYTLILDSHSNLANHIEGKIKAGVFNLGYLPGADKSKTTQRETTYLAVTAAIEKLDLDGVLLVAVYPGHEEGNLEGEMLYDVLSKYSRFEYCVSKFQIINSPTSPYFFLIEQNNGRKR